MTLVGAALEHKVGSVREDGIRLAAQVYTMVGKKISPFLEHLKPAMVDLLNQAFESGPQPPANLAPVGGPLLVADAAPKASPPSHPVAAKKTPANGTVTCTCIHIYHIYIHTYVLLFDYVLSCDRVRCASCEQVPRRHRSHPPKPLRLALRGLRLPGPKVPLRQLREPKGPRRVAKAAKTQCRQALIPTSPTIRPHTAMKPTQNFTVGHVSFAMWRVPTLRMNPSWTIIFGRNAPCCQCVSSVSRSLKFPC